MDGQHCDEAGEAVSVAIDAEPRTSRGDWNGAGRTRGEFSMGWFTTPAADWWSSAASSGHQTARQTAAVPAR